LTIPAAKATTDEDNLRETLGRIEHLFSVGSGLA
jgi:hypothetical protein